MMKPIKYLTIALISIVALSLFNSCKKIQTDTLIKGLWQVKSVKIDTIQSNYLNNFQHYPNGNECCQYKLDFQADDIVFAYYITYDTFNYVVAGNWYLNQYNEIYLNFDNYFDGTFDIAKTSPGHYTLTSEQNHIKAFDGINAEMDTTFTELKMEKI